MNYRRWKSTFYYAIKPVLPRLLQIIIRQKQITLKARGVQNVWPIDSLSGTTPDGWRGWPSGRTFAFVLTHDVESDRGVKRCMRLAQTEKMLGFVSSFNFVPEKYPLSAQLRDGLSKRGFEVGVHDLKHDGKLFSTEKAFLRRVRDINHYLESWGAVGFRSGSMYHNLAWMHQMKIEYDASTFDTDPFEPRAGRCAYSVPYLGREWKWRWRICRASLYSPSGLNPVHTFPVFQYAYLEREAEMDRQQRGNGPTCDPS